MLFQVLIKSERPTNSFLIGLMHLQIVHHDFHLFASVILGQNTHAPILYELHFLKRRQFLLVDVGFFHALQGPLRGILPKYLLGAIGSTNFRIIIDRVINGSENVFHFGVHVRQPGSVRVVPIIFLLNPLKLLLQFSFFV